MRMTKKKKKVDQPKQESTPVAETKTIPAAKGPGVKKVSRKLLISVGGVTLLLMAGITSAVVWKQQIASDQVNMNEQINQTQKQDQEIVAAPVTLPRRIDGITVATADANKVPACVMIENTAFSGVRPQSGLAAASIVYEVIVEGGITRLMAVYAGEPADSVGPVRSARDTYLEFASEYNCAYIHAGGSYSAMTALPKLGLRDIDALRESKWFWRDSSKFSPHNLFTNTSNLYDAVAKGHSWTTEPTYETWKFVDDDQVTAGEEANQINIGFGGEYDVTYTYNTENKFYERTNGRALHTDANTGKALTARNIVIQHVPEGELIEGKGRINFSVTGEGVVEIIRQGVLTQGTWKKANRLSRTQFFTPEGQEIPLVRGNVWIEVVPAGYAVSWE